MQSCSALSSVSSLIDRRGFLPQDEWVQAASRDTPPPADAPVSQINVVGGASRPTLALQEPLNSPVCPNSADAP